MNMNEKNTLSRCAMLINRTSQMISIPQERANNKYKFNCVQLQQYHWIECHFCIKNICGDFY